MGFEEPDSFPLTLAVSHVSAGERGGKMAAPGARLLVLTCCRVCSHPGPATPGKPLLAWACTHPGRALAGEQLSPHRVWLQKESLCFPWCDFLFSLTLLK